MRKSSAPESNKVSLLWLFADGSADLNAVVTVHKDRRLDLVGWYTLLPPSGPSPTILPIHSQMLEGFNESAVLLGFHPEEVLKSSVGGKLPLTIYESNYEVDDSKAEQDGEDKTMDDGEATLKLRFRELTYSVETEETEMISMNYVATGGRTAAAAAAKEERPSRSIESNGKGKRRLVENKDDYGMYELPTEDLTLLTRAEDETIASLTTKVNAIKMLHSRIQLLTAYLEKLPPSYVNGETTETGADSMDTDFITPSLPVLRQIQALVSRLDLVIPSDRDSFENEVLHETNDVNVIGLLNTIMQSVDQARDVGKKFGVVESYKSSSRRGGTEYGGMSSYTQSGAAEMI